MPFAINRNIKAKENLTEILKKEYAVSLKKRPSPFSLISGYSQSKTLDKCDF